MYGLPQAGLLAQNRLITHLATHGYHQTEATCLFRHENNGTDFSLVIDDFGVKYSNKSGAQHLIDTLQKLYIITIDWTDSKYLGFSIVFDHDRHTVDISMQGYIEKVLQRFSAIQISGAASPAHPATSIRQQSSPHTCISTTTARNHWLPTVLLLQSSQQSIISPRFRLNPLTTL